MAETFNAQSFEELKEEYMKSMAAYFETCQEHGGFSPKASAAWDTYKDLKDRYIKARNRKHDG